MRNPLRQSHRRAQYQLASGYFDRAPGGVTPGGVTPADAAPRRDHQDPESARAGVALDCLAIIDGVARRGEGGPVVLPRAAFTACMADAQRALVLRAWARGVPLAIAWERGA